MILMHLPALAAAAPECPNACDAHFTKDPTQSPHNRGINTVRIGTRLFLSLSAQAEVHVCSLQH